MPTRTLLARLLRTLVERGRAAATPPADPASRPFTRWWWFSGPIEHEVVESQLDWALANGFGGVEIAWVYPLREGRDGRRWLSPEWTDLVVHAKRYADRLGLGCDFTFDTLWPFGGSFVLPEDSHQTFDGPSYRPLERTWESAHEDEPGLVLDHLDRDALARYARVMGAALAPALGGRTSALFCDSWEVPTRRMWSPKHWARFRERFGYDLRDVVDRLDEDEHARYDYRAFIADAVLDEFYRPFTEICHGLGAASRVQCHGAPTDLIAAYGAVDVPETEVLLFPPPFARIAASAAALGGKPVVSCEAFTCPYGFPAVHFKQERASDLRLLADTAIAHGVNQVVWHGMPYNPPGGSDAFFATTHVGPDAAFAAEIPALNDYLADLCSWMRRGRTYAGLAVYLPVEDNRMRDRLPPSLRTPAAHSYWELRQEVVPEEAEPYGPLWVSEASLSGATWDGTKLHVGSAEFDALLLDCRWLDAGTLDAALRLAEAGLPVALPHRPRRPGREAAGDYEAKLDALAALPNVRRDLGELGLTPLVECEPLPPYWGAGRRRRAGPVLRPPGGLGRPLPDDPRAGSVPPCRQPPGRDPLRGPPSPGHAPLPARPIGPAAGRGRRGRDRRPPRAEGRVPVEGHPLDRQGKAPARACATYGSKSPGRPGGRPDVAGAVTVATGHGRRRLTDPAASIRPR